MGLLEDHFRTHGWPRTKEDAIAAKAVYEKARVIEEEQRELDCAREELKCLKFIDWLRNPPQAINDVKRLLLRAAIPERFEGGGGI